MWYMNEEREMLKKSVDEFAVNEVRPFVKKMEKNETYPRELIKKAGDLGILGLATPEEYGGVGVDWINLGIAMEEISKESTCVGLLLMMNAVGSTLSLQYVGTEEQKEKILKPCIAGDDCLAMSLCEPVGSSNTGAYKTRAVQDGDDWIISGGKIFCTMAGQCKYYGVMALTGDYNPQTQEGATMFLIPADTPGFSVGHIEDKLAWHGSSTGSLLLDNCRVNKKWILGEVNHGLQAFGSTTMQTYAYLGILALGGAEGVYERTLKYTKEREHIGGGTLYNNYEVVRYHLVNMYTKIESCRSLLFECFELMQQGREGVKQCMAAKIYAQQVFEEVASMAVNLNGGNGLMVENDIERYYRESKMLAVGGFSVDIIREQIAALL